MAAAPPATYDIVVDKTYSKVKMTAADKASFAQGGKLTTTKIPGDAQIAGVEGDNIVLLQFKKESLTLDGIITSIRKHPSAVDNNAVEWGSVDYREFIKGILESDDFDDDSHDCSGDQIEYLCGRTLMFAEGNTGRCDEMEGEDE